MILKFSGFRVSVLLVVCLMWPAHVFSQSEVTPEDFSAHQDADKSAIPTKTVYVKENNPRKLVTKLNKLHDEYAKSGWILFLLNTYIKNEDVKGMFVTYRKVGITE